MKKLLLSALVLCMAFFVSCSKNSDSAANSGDNGGGGGNKHLSEYHFREHVEKATWNEETQTWDTTVYQEGAFHVTSYNWNGDKLTNVTDNDYINFDFQYNDLGLASKVIYHQTDHHEQLDTMYLYYNDKKQINKLDKIEYTGFWENGYMSTSWDIQYTNDKPTKIICTTFGSYINMSWIGDNISEIQIFDEANNLLETVTYTYDDYNNPMYGFNSMDAMWLASGMDWDGIALEYPKFQPQNNVLTMRMSQYTRDNSYLYNGNYPYEQTYVEISGGETTKYIVTYTTKFIYLD